MHRLRLAAGRLAEALGGAAGGGGEGEPQALLLEDGDDAADQGRLAGPRAAGQDHHLGGQGPLQGVALLGRQADLPLALEPADGPLDVDLERQGVLSGELPHQLGDASLGDRQGLGEDRLLASGVVLGTRR